MNKKYRVICEKDPDLLTSKINKVVEGSLGTTTVDSFDVEIGPPGTGIHYCALLSDKAK